MSKTETKIPEGYTSAWEKEGRTAGKRFPPCTREEKDCASIDICGNCRALDDTWFDGPCPFYKQWQEVEPRDMRHYKHNEMMRKHRDLYYQSSLPAKKGRKLWTAMTIHEARERSGVDVAEIAKALGITKRAYMRLEEHPQEMTVSQAKKLIRLIDLEPYDIFTEVTA